jgi:hypothetical protein
LSPWLGKADIGGCRLRCNRLQKYEGLKCDMSTQVIEQGRRIS